MKTKKVSEIEINFMRDTISKLLFPYERMDASNFSEVLYFLQFIEQNDAELDLSEEDKKILVEYKETLNTEFEKSFNSEVLLEEKKVVDEKRVSFKAILDKSTLVKEIAKNVVDQTELVKRFLETREVYRKNIDNYDDQISDKSLEPKKRILICNEEIEFIRNFKEKNFKELFRSNEETILSANALTLFVRSRGSEDVKRLYKSFIKNLFTLMISRRRLFSSLDFTLNFDLVMPTKTIEANGLFEFKVKTEEIEKLVKAVSIMPIDANSDLKSYSNVLESLSAFKSSIGEVEDRFSRIGKLVTCFGIIMENFNQEQIINAKNNINQLLSLTKSTKDLFIEIALEELEINWKEYTEYQNEFNNQELIGNLLFLIFDLIQAFVPDVRLDNTGIFVNNGLLGLDKRFISKAEIYQFIETFKKNPERYDLGKIKIQLDNLRDEDSITYVWRQQEKGSH